ncbi:MAG: glutathione S-transferase N-terminal domain-containing protein [Myxococcota bacterium]
MTAHGTTDNGKETISLYGYPQCPFCARVLRAIEELDLDVPLRNTMQDGSSHDALVEATGRPTVPVLRIEHADGEVEWLPESADIIRYLIDHYG